MAVRSPWFASPTGEFGSLSDPGSHSAELGRDAGSHPKVVAHFLDGRLVKGFALDFRTSRQDFLLKLRDADEAAEAIPVRLGDLKALFFVKDFDGDPTYRESADAARPSLLGRRVWVRFRDGERLRGTTPSQDLRGRFFLVPLDTRSNNRRVFVVPANAVECRFESGNGP